ncbi:MAG: protein kinase family protein [Melioribacteraceae bacterium]|nr:protein kinase family protein [Melioribacteraceae bacterium]
MNNEIISFLRQKDYKFIRDIGEGGCAKTVLLKDDLIDELFVCKKYSPLNGLQESALFDKFVQEIKLLHMLSHQNIVRFFNHYLYPQEKVGYILMEYIEGDNIEGYVKLHPEDVSDLFIQTIDAFNYLENIDILHRDIRPYNILVTNTGIVKVIDFGFGKKIDFGKDYEKSITLNWWCDILPREFQEKIYDRKTEIYFVGRLFEKIILENEINNFAYKELLNKMIEVDEQKRIDSFSTIKRAILTSKLSELDFSEDEKFTYRKFADTISTLFIKIDEKAKYSTDIDQIIKRLEKVYKSSLLEEILQNNLEITRCFVTGSYTYQTRPTMEVPILEDFLSLMKSCSRDKQNIILNNLWGRFDTIKRYSEEEDDLPF